MIPEVNFSLEGEKPFYTISVPQIDVTDELMDNFNNNYKKALKTAEKTAQVQLLAKQAKKILKLENTVRSLEGSAERTMKRFKNDYSELYRENKAIKARCKVQAEVITELREKEKNLNNLEKSMEYIYGTMVHNLGQVIKQAKKQAQGLKNER